MRASGLEQPSGLLRVDGHRLFHEHVQSPLQGRDTTFAKYNKPDLDTKDPWQFKNFLVTDAG